MFSSFYIKTFVLVSLLFLNICCGNRESNKKIIAVHEMKDSIQADSILEEIDTTSPGAINLATAKNIEILSINKELDKNSNDEVDYSKCKSWSLTIDQLKKIIRNFKSIASEDQNYSYSYMPCGIKGKIRIDTTEFEYWLNAGATLTLRNKKTEYHFGCSGKKCRMFFITVRLTDKELHQ
jgi:hypothetical protein